MSCMGVVSVRLDDETEKWIRDHGERPGTFCRLAVMKEVQRREVEDARQRMKQGSRRPRGATGTEIVRHDRDHGHQEHRFLGDTHSG